MSFDYAAIDALKSEHDVLRDKVSKLIEFQLKHNKDFFQEFADYDLKNIEFFEKGYELSITNFLDMDGGDEKKKVEYDEIIRKIKLRTTLLEIQKGFYKVYLKDKDKPDNPHIDEMSLTSILREVLEASLQKDAKKNQLANGYIKNINDLINKHKVKLVGFGQFWSVQVDLDDFDIHFYSSHSGGTKAEYDATAKPKPIISVYRCEISKEPLSVKYDENVLRHEIIHHLDYKTSKTSPDKLKSSSMKQNKDYSSYINSPLEVNAHFFELFMNNIVQMIEKEREIPPSFDEFQRDITNDPKAKEFLEDLDEKNKRKVLKRLGTYYNDILKNPDFKIQNGDKIDDTRLKKATNGFISKIKSFFKAA